MTAHCHESSNRGAAARPPDPSIEQVAEWLRLFIEPGQVAELRAPKVRDNPKYPEFVVGGFFDYEHIDAMARRAMEISPYAEAVYFVFNPVDPELLCIHRNEAVRKPKGSAGANHVLRRRWLVMDADPTRISATTGKPLLPAMSATDGEKALARARIDALVAKLTAMGWPAPILGDSGNGYHAWYRVDLPADDGGLVEAALKAANAMFGDDRVKIDTLLSDPSRNIKLYGTRSRKGEDDPDRPHRTARVLEVPDECRVVPEDLLRALAELAPKDKPKDRAKEKSKDGAKDKPKDGTKAGEKASRSTLARARAYIAKMPDSVEGDHGHARLMAVACVLIDGFGLSREDAVTLLAEWNQAHARPPEDRKQVEHKVDSAIKAYPRPSLHLLNDQEDDEKETQAEVLLRLASDATLFHTAEGRTFTTVAVGEHREHHPIRSTAFRRWLVRLFYGEQGRPPSAEALQGTLGVLEARAHFDGDLDRVWTRVADGPDGSIFLDLCNEAWQAVRVDQHGWSVVSNPPVKFRRTKGMLPLPVPEAGGTIGQLRPFFNVPDEDWRLLVACLTADFRPHGPYPIKAIQGEQGSAKSTTSRAARRLIDPHVTPLRCEPKEVRDLMIAATNAWLVAFDNLSTVPTWLSDALCRLSTGGGFATRTLYADDEETHLDATRPVALNGIEDFAARDDLRDRCVFFHLPTIPEDRRKEEATFWADFDAAHPRLLGALLDAVSGGLRELPAVHLGCLPRMADFARWGEAVGRALGWEPGEFLASYTANRGSAHADTVEDSPVASAVWKLLGSESPWEGTASDLLTRLGESVGEKVVASKRWPKSPRALAGTLRRVAPALRGVGIEVEFDRDAERRTITLSRREPESKRETPSSPSSPSSGTEEFDGSPIDDLDFSDSQGHDGRDDANRDGPPDACFASCQPSSEDVCHKVVFSNGFTSNLPPIDDGHDANDGISPTLSPGREVFEL